MYQLNKEYRIEREGIGFTLIPLVKFDQWLIGTIRADDTNYLQPMKWDMFTGEDPAKVFDLPKLTNRFDKIGEYKTVSTVVARVNAISPHESTQFRLIGYVMNARGHMWPASWNKNGKCRENSDWDFSEIQD